MNVLIVHAHPEPRSFCSALKDVARSYFESKGDHVVVSDLYAMGFNPVGGKGDFVSLKEEDYFKYQAEQVHAYQSNGYAPDLEAEMKKVHEADLIIINFPLWWFGLPAILKGWVDRVFAMGFIYGAGKGVYDNGAYPEKRAFTTFTTGGPQPAYGDAGKNGEFEHILFPIQHGMFYFTGMTVLPPFISFGPARKSQEEREQDLDRYKEHLGSLDSLTPIYEAKQTE